MSEERQNPSFCVRPSGARWRLASLVFPLCLASFGCATYSRAPVSSPWVINDPPTLSPQNQPLYTRRPEDSILPETADVESVLPGTILPEIATVEGDDQTNSAQSSSGKPVEAPPPLSGPMLVPARPKSDLEFSVIAPPKKQTGSGALFLLKFRNRGIVPLRNVVVRCDFAKPLTLPGVAEQAAVQDLGDIAAGEVRETTLTLFSDQQGEHCCEFSVSSAGEESVWKSVCVEFVEPQFTLEIVGPTERDIDSRAEFTISVANTSREDRDDVRVILNFPEELQAREATSNPMEEAGRLTWKLGKLKAGEGVRLQAEFVCVTEAEKVCLSAELRGPEVPWESAETCLAVGKPVGVLQMRLQDQADPVDVGDETAYVIYLDHRGLQAVRNVRLQVELPDNFRLIAVESREDDTLLDLKYRQENGMVMLDPLLIVRPGVHQKFLIRVKAVAEGAAEVQAHLRTGTSDEPLTLSEPTMIRPDPLRKMPPQIP